MVVIHDIRSRTPRSNGTRSLSKISKLARHHSGGDSGSWDSFWPYWNKIKGWGTGGYHEIILKDGSVQLCYDAEEVTNGVGGHNSYVYNICVVGNGSFTEEQELAWEERARFNLKRLGLDVNDVLGHNEFSGTNTACPGINMNTVRRRLAYLNDSKKPKPVSAKPVSAKTVYTKPGDTGSAVKELQQDLISVGYKIKADSSFGPATEKSVKDFQSKQKLVVDGSAGPATLKALSRVIEISKEKPKPKPAVVATSPSSYKGDSIIEYLELTNQDSSFQDRTRLANEYGIKDYKGTADQNIQLLSKLRTKVSPIKGDQKTSSIIDYLMSIKASPSFANRKELANKHGIRNYIGSGTQNTDLLNKLRK